ncbi:hypothetical protein Zmor_004438 [Zophobas morio]|uniref:Uncharacterized protein n=1 Tax=Zophobas morio TaxID=2755281 RepID=A0AA38M0A0_9CUCU|nr:hypothetical protein Zmor_004438 [Zophobas morio]
MSASHRVPERVDPELGIRVRTSCATRTICQCSRVRTTRSVIIEAFGTPFAYVIRDITSGSGHAAFRTGAARRGGGEGSAWKGRFCGVGRNAKRAAHETLKWGISFRWKYRGSN